MSDILEAVRIECANHAGRAASRGNDDYLTLQTVFVGAERELTRLRARVAELEAAHRKITERYCDAETARAAAERDAARYRYMRDDGYGVTIDVLEYDDDGGEDWVSGHSPADLDEAIDRFMQPDNGGSGSQL